MVRDVRLSDDDALDVVGAAERRREDGDLDATEFPSALLAQAGATIIRALRRQGRDLERERARSYRDDAPRVPGARLVARDVHHDAIDGNDGGGFGTICAASLCTAARVCTC